MPNWRHPRYMSGRDITTGESKAYMVFEWYHSEMPSTMELYWRITAKTSTKVEQAMEYNLDVLAFPQFLVSNFRALTGDVSQATPYQSPVSDADWDELYKHYVFSVGSDARSYGGEIGPTVDLQDNPDRTTSGGTAVDSDVRERTGEGVAYDENQTCLLYTSPSPRDS